MDPYTQNCSFQNLLNSQNPYQSVPREPTVEVSASDASMLSSPWNEDVDDDVEILSDRKERRKWTLTEDVVLISAWLNTSKDPVAATKQRSSGQNENDVLKLAHMIFFNDHKAKFNLEHAWLELRHDQKWSGASCTKDKVQAKRRKLDAQSSTSMAGQDEPMARPKGVKAAKAKRKNPGSKQATSEAEQKEKIEFQSFWEIRQSDFALKLQVCLCRVFSSSLYALSSSLYALNSFESVRFGCLWLMDVYVNGSAFDVFVE
ncbi:glutathione S-transferase T3-like [Brassica napus]|uniref:glutathione S-transferase T3-like n=1 Tax=Brassica napus TaxID=3708 RepID=UPI000BBED354|nr:glutathione S-transferase T3-like [Brassica napus]